MSGASAKLSQLRISLKALCSSSPQSPVNWKGAMHPLCAIRSLSLLALLVGYSSAALVMPPSANFWHAAWLLLPYSMRRRARQCCQLNQISYCLRQTSYRSLLAGEGRTHALGSYVGLSASLCLACVNYSSAEFYQVKQDTCPQAEKHSGSAGLCLPCLRQASQR